MDDDKFSEAQQECLKKCKAMLGEHFENSLIVVEGVTPQGVITDWQGNFQSYAAQLGMLQIVHMEQKRVKKTYNTSSGDDKDDRGEVGAC